MEIQGRDFLNTPPVKTVRFGGSVADTLIKHKRVSENVMPYFYLSILYKVERIKVLLLLFEGRLE